MRIAMRTSQNISLFFLLCLILQPFAFSQDYYPLRIGNEWFYRSVNLPPNDSTISFSVCVIDDSLFSNGHWYFVLNENDIMGQRFVRADSTSVYYITPYTGQEQRLIKLDGQVGDTTWLGWGPYAFVRLARIDTLTVFGFSQRLLTFELDGLLYALVKLCEKFGPLIEWRYSDPPPPWPEWGRELVGCTIDSVRYGNTLGITDNDYFPQSFELYQNFPNPFNPETHIAYTLRSRSAVVLRIFDLLGREISTLVDQIEPAGTRSMMWDGRDRQGRPVSSGVYVYQLQTPEFSQARRMLLLR
jgi:hypothetical protein